MTAYVIRHLDSVVSVADFQCGKPPLDEYIRRYASQDVRRNVARVFVAAPETEPGRIAGYYTLSAGSVNCSDLPQDVAKKLPRYPIPVALIGRLAVDKRFQGQGLGSILLADACSKISKASTTLAVAGIIVDAKDEAAAAFYRHFGFSPLQGQENRLLLTQGAFVPGPAKRG